MLNKTHFFVEFYIKLWYNLGSAFSLKDINELVATGKFSYSDFDDYIRNDNNVQKETVDKIEHRIKKYLFKLKPIAHYVPYFDDENKR